jgi:hypothetical protein
MLDHARELQPIDPLSICNEINRESG